MEFKLQLLKKEPKVNKKTPNGSIVLGPSYYMIGSREEQTLLRIY